MTSVCLRRRGPARRRRLLHGGGDDLSKVVRLHLWATDRFLGSMGFKEPDEAIGVVAHDRTHASAQHRESVWLRIVSRNCTEKNVY